MTWDKATGTLGGTATKSGTYDVFLVSGSGADTQMMRTTISVAGYEPIVGYVGVAFAWTGVPVSVFESYKNLPAGLKWANGSLAGVPTKAGDFSRVTTSGDAVSFVIEALPQGAVGAFNGVVTLNGTNLPVVVTTTAAGKLTAKVTSGTKTISYSAKNWARAAKNAEGHLILSATLVGSKETLSLTIDASAEWTADAATLAVTGGTLAGATGHAQRNAYGKVGKVWENETAHAFALAHVGTYTFNADAAGAGVWNLVSPLANKEGTLKLQVKETGVVTVSGKLDGTSYSATTTLRSNGQLFFYAKGRVLTGLLSHE